MKKVFYLFGITAVLMSLTFCKKVSPEDENAIISTMAPADVTSTSATLKGFVSYGAEEFSDVGFIYDKAGSLKKDSSPRVAGVQDKNSFSAVLNGLSPATDYEYIARAIIDGKEEFAKPQTFTTAAIAVQSIQIEPKSLVLYFGRNESAQLTAKVVPDNATDPSVTWSSSDPKIATVSDKGLVQAVGEGDAVITATSSDGKVKGQCPVSVKFVTVTDLTLSPTSAKICSFQGKTLQLTATVEPADAVNKTLTWSSSDPNVATVSSSGLVTAIANGTASISVSATSGSGGKIVKSCSIRVYFPPEAVDLGLSVKWAAANLMAASPEQKGTYGTWGWADVEGAPSYYYGSETTLPMSCDAARVNLGGTWRLPTAQELQDLFSQCTWVWGSNGYTITGKNGKSIFLPVTGGYYAGYSWKETKNGYYWASTRANASTEYPHLLRIEPDGSRQVYYSTQSFLLSHYKAFYRPVCSK